MALEGFLSLAKKMLAQCMESQRIGSSVRRLPGNRADNWAFRLNFKNLLAGRAGKPPSWSVNRAIANRTLRTAFEDGSMKKLSNEGSYGTTYIITSEQARKYASSFKFKRVSHSLPTNPKTPVLLKAIVPDPKMSKLGWDDYLREVDREINIQRQAKRQVAQHVPSIYYAGIDPTHGFAVILMQYIDGVTLRQYVKRGHKIDAKLYRRLDDAFKRLWVDGGIVHMDVHGGNILIEKKTLRPYIIDFTTASRIGEKGRAVLKSYFTSHRNHPAFMGWKALVESNVGTETVKELERQYYHYTSRGKYNPDWMYLAGLFKRSGQQLTSSPPRLSSGRISAKPSPLRIQGLPKIRVATIAKRRLRINPDTPPLRLRTIRSDPKTKKRFRPREFRSGSSWGISAFLGRKTTPAGGGSSGASPFSAPFSSRPSAKPGTSYGQLNPVSFSIPASAAASVKPQEATLSGSLLQSPYLSATSQVSNGSPGSSTKPSAATITPYNNVQAKTSILNYLKLLNPAAMAALSKIQNKMPNTGDFYNKVQTFEADWTRIPIKGDGHCMFRAIAKGTQLNGANTALSEEALMDQFRKTAESVCADRSTGLKVNEVRHARNVLSEASKLVSEARTKFLSPNYFDNDDLLLKDAELFCKETAAKKPNEVIYGSESSAFLIAWVHNLRIITYIMEGGVYKKYNDTKWAFPKLQTRATISLVVDIRRRHYDLLVPGKLNKKSVNR